MMRLSIALLAVLCIALPVQAQCPGGVCPIPGGGYGGGYYSAPQSYSPGYFQQPITYSQPNFSFPATSYATPPLSYSSGVGPGCASCPGCNGGASSFQYQAPVRYGVPVVVQRYPFTITETRTRGVEVFDLPPDIISLPPTYYRYDSGSYAYGSEPYRRRGLELNLSVRGRCR